MEKVKLQPTKRLFIDTLTKDISIRDCIFDLLDNSIDSYVRHNGRGRRKINLEFDRNKFTIFDNCGGIDKNQLINQVFRFGLTDISGQFNTIGMYGIGLKRSIFKLGKEIRFETDDGKDYCLLSFNVDDWLNSGDGYDKWDLTLTKTHKTLIRKPNRPYTKIQISKLNHESKEVFTRAFETALKEDVKLYYTQFIGRGIRLCINGEILEPFEISIQTPEGYSPARIVEKKQDLKIEITCWIEASNLTRRTRKKGHQGWNVFMNERLVVIDDVSHETGWTGKKSALPKYHPIFNAFRGIVFLSTNDPRKLPINTSKNGFDMESPTYFYMLDKMIAVARPLINFLEKQYSHKRSDIEDRQTKLISDIDSDNLEFPQRTIRIDRLPEKSVFKHPKISKKKSKKLTKISYEKNRDEVELLKRYLEVRSNAEVGSKTFDYYYEDVKEIINEE